MAKLYIVGFEGKSKERHAVINNNQSVKDNLSYGGEATFMMRGDHGAVFDTYFCTVLTWDSKGNHATFYGKERYGLR